MVVVVVLAGLFFRDYAGDGGVSCFTLAGGGLKEWFI